MAWSYPVLAPLSQGCPKLKGRSSTRYSPVRHFTRPTEVKAFSFDLHVLSTPPAFILSQDQTLQFFPACSLTKTQHILSLFSFQRTEAALFLPQPTNLFFYLIGHGLVNPFFLTRRLFFCERAILCSTLDSVGQVFLFASSLSELFFIAICFFAVNHFLDLF